MKSILKTGVSACLLASSLMVVTNSQAVATRGVPSCGSWVSERKKSGTLELVYKSWLLGYLSGISVGTNLDVMRDSDSESISLWMDNYCNANPLEDVDVAGVKLHKELVRNKRMK